jgi:hypothetical protein
VLNTVLYNWKEGINNAVKKRLSKSSLSPFSPSDANSLFDRRIDLITEGIDSFFGSILREVLGENALTIVNYVLSMRSEFEYWRQTVSKNKMSFTLIRHSSLLSLCKTVRRTCRNEIDTRGEHHSY